MLSSQKFRLLIWLLLSQLTATCAIADQHDERKAAAYGQTLFSLQQQRYFPAITHLLMARQQNLLRDDGIESQLLLAGLYLSFGMHNEAEKLFKQHLADDSLPVLRDKAWFYLAKVRYQRGLYEATEEALRQIQAILPPALQEERLHMHGQIMLSRGRHRWASARFRKIKNASIWAIYGRYNLGIALLELEERSAGTALLDAIGQMKTGHEEMKALKDQANLALGFYLLEQRRPERAREVLRRIRLDKSITNLALLGIGWTHSQQANHESALAVWEPLSKKSLSDPAVQESYLTIPHAYAELGAEKQAENHYEMAIKLFQREVTRLEKSIAMVQSQNFFPQHQKKSGAVGDEWLSWVTLLPNTPLTRDLAPLLVSHEFQNAINNLRDLLYVKHNLELWAIELDAFHLKATKQGSTADQGVQIALHELERRYQQLIARQQNLKQIKIQEKPLMEKLILETQGEIRLFQDLLLDVDRMGDNLPVATGAEKQRIKRRKELLRKMRTFAKNPKTEENFRKYRYFNDLLDQQSDKMNQSQKVALDKELTDIDLRTSEIQQREQSLILARDIRPTQLKNDVNKITATKKRIAELLSTIQEAEDKQAAELSAMAIEILDKQKRLLEGNLIRAHFSLSRIHDRALGTQEMAE